MNSVQVVFCFLLKSGFLFSLNLSDYVPAEKEPDSCSTADLESLGETTDILNMVMVFFEFYLIMYLCVYFQYSYVYKIYLFVCWIVFGHTGRNQDLLTHGFVLKDHS